MRSICEEVRYERDPALTEMRETWRAVMKWVGVCAVLAACGVAYSAVILGRIV